jgi:glucose/arabinose dehydrogenase
MRTFIARAAAGLTLTFLATAAAAQCKPIESQPPNGKGQRPAFAGQTRACAAPSAASFDVVVLAKGLEHPWAVEPLPGGDLLVTERPGRMRIVSAKGELGAPLAGLPKVDARGQGGLLDVALSPTFESDRTLYWSFSEPRQGGNATSVARGVLSADRRSLEQVKVILQAMPTYDGDKHFGSRLAFGTDGMLYVTLGERSDKPMRPQAQRMDSHMGKVLRVKPDGSAQPEIWTLGHRNVQAAAFDAKGRLWVVEHGTRGGDELNLIEKGKNYGWPLVAYGIEYSGEPIPGAVTDKPGFEQPVYYWDPVIAALGRAVLYRQRIPGVARQSFRGCAGTEAPRAPRPRERSRGGRGAPARRSQPARARRAPGSGRRALYSDRRAQRRALEGRSAQVDATPRERGGFHFHRMVEGGTPPCRHPVCSQSVSPLSPPRVAATARAATTTRPDPATLAQGKQIFRFDTFGDESKWTDTLRMHEVIRTAVDPTTALSVGLKVDAEALPPAVVQGIQNGSISLTSPDTTVALLKLDAVVGLKGTVENIGGKDTLTRVGITCALCHSTVDNSFAPGIGKRLDGWANRDLNPGRDHRALAGPHGGAEGRLQFVGQGQVRPALQPRRHLERAGDSAGLRARRLAPHHLHRRRRRNRLLESLRGRDADGRPWDVQRCAHRSERHQRQRRPGEREACRRCRPTSSPSPRRRRPRGASTRSPRCAARRSSRARGSAPPATPAPNSPMPTRGCIRRPTS